MAAFVYYNVEFNWVTLADREAALNSYGLVGWELVTIIDWKSLNTNATNGAMSIGIVNPSPMFTSRATFKQPS